MAVTVTISKTLDDAWGTDEELKSLSDGEILELCKEDLLALVDGACWSVDR